MTREEALAALEAATTQEEWDAVCEKIAPGRPRAYPDWWARDVIVSGLLAEKSVEFC